MKPRGGSTQSHEWVIKTELWEEMQQVSDTSISEIGIVCTKVNPATYACSRGRRECSCAFVSVLFE